MKLKISMVGLPAYKVEFFEADLHYFTKYVKFEVIESIDKLKGNRNFAFKILNIIAKKTPLGRITLEQFLTNLKLLKEFPLADYQILEKKNDKITAILEVNDVYFMVCEQLRKQVGPFGKISKVGYTKKEFLEKVEKEIKATYRPKDYKIEVMKA